MNPTLSVLLSVILSITFWLAVVLLSVMLRGRRYTIGPVILLWCLHAAIFWTVSATRRLVFGYVGPSSTMTYWSIIIYLQAGLSTLGMLYLARHRLPPPT